MTRLSYATVLADCIETRYLRTGTGPTVVALRPVSLNMDPGLDPLVTALGTQFKIIVPELPASLLGLKRDEPATLSWLRGFLDGLGIREALLLVPWQLSWLAAGLRREDPDRVQGIAILVDDARPEAVRTAVGGFFGIPPTT